MMPYIDTALPLAGDTDVVLSKSNRTNGPMEDDNKVGSLSGDAGDVANRK